MQHCKQRHVKSTVPQITAVLNEVSSTSDLTSSQSPLAYKPRLPSEYSLPREQQQILQPAGSAQPSKQITLERGVNSSIKAFVLPKHTSSKFIYNKQRSRKGVKVC